MIDNVNNQFVKNPKSMENNLNYTADIPLMDITYVKTENNQHTVNCNSNVDGRYTPIYGEPEEASVAKIINEKGKENVHFSNYPSTGNWYARLLKDYATSMTDIRWRWVLFIVCAWYFGSWVFFALLWKYAGIDDEIRDIDIYTTNTCIISTGTFIGYIKQSVELQTTMGGPQYPTEYCHIGWLLMGIQLLVNIFVEAGILGLAFAKFWRPQTKVPFVNVFSKKVVVCLRDNSLCIVFRFFDEEGKYSVLNRLRACFVMDRVTKEGEVLPNFLVTLKLEPKGILFQWPVEVVHTITPESPFWKFTKNDFANKSYQIIVELVGDSLVTGETSQNNISYTNDDICWGHEFVPCIEFDDKLESYVIQHENIDKTYLMENQEKNS